MTSFLNALRSLIMLIHLGRYHTAILMGIKHRTYSQDGRLSSAIVQIMKQFGLVRTGMAAHALVSQSTCAYLYSQPMGWAESTEHLQGCLRNI